MDNKALIRAATWEMGDWFSRLGGANRYPGMYESDIFLYIGCTALDLHLNTDLSEELVHPRLVLHAKNSAVKANDLLAKLEGGEDEIRSLVAGFARHHDRKLSNERSPQWIDFVGRALDAGSDIDIQ